jgi:hypothetical protein
MSDQPTQKQNAVSRPLVGAITIALLLAWTVTGLLQYTGTWHGDEANLDMWRAGFLRVGLLMFALWIALPTKDRPAAWSNISKPMLFGLLLAIVLVAVRPWIAIPLLAVLAVASLILRPRARRRPQSRAG